MLGSLGKQGAIKVAVHQAGEVVNFRLDVRQFLEFKGVAHAHGGTRPLLLVGSEILVADGAGGLGRLPIEVGTRTGKPRLHVGVGGIQLGEQSRLVAALGRREAGGHHGAAQLLALVALIVNVVVQGHRADDQHIICIFHALSPHFV